MKYRQRTPAWARLAAVPLLVIACPMAGCAGEEGSVPEPWRGTLAEGLGAMADLSADQQFDDALEVAARMDRVGALAGLRARAAEVSGGASERVLAPLDRSLAALGFPVLTSPQRGEIEFARALTLLASVAAAEAPGRAKGPAEANEGRENAAGRLERAVQAFERARSAGGGASLDAVYDLGTLDLEVAESIRATIPEVSGGPPPPPSSDKDAAGGKDDRDPLEVARAAYLAARKSFVERLRMGESRDARANVELVLRRLRELEEIERQREEQQDQQSDGDPSGDPQENEGSQDEEEDPSESDEEAPEEQEGEQDSESEQPAEDQPEDAGEEEPSEEDAEEDAGEELQPPAEQAEEESEPEERKSDEESEGEELMTKEELGRILDRNRKYQENGEKLRRILRIKRKVPVRRDW